MESEDGGEGEKADRSLGYDLVINTLNKTLRAEELGESDVREFFVRKMR